MPSSHTRSSYLMAPHQCFRPWYLYTCYILCQHDTSLSAWKIPISSVRVSSLKPFLTLSSTFFVPMLYFVTSLLYHLLYCIAFVFFTNWHLCCELLGWNLNSFSTSRPTTMFGTYSNWFYQCIICFLNKYKIRLTNSINCGIPKWIETLVDFYLVYWHQILR